MNNNHKNWLPINPSFGRFRKAKMQYLSLARQLQRWLRNNNDATVLQEIRLSFLNHENEFRRDIWPTFKAAGLLLMDLVEQGWNIRIRTGTVEVSQPICIGVSQKKELVRKQELIKRNEQLNKSSTLKFIQDVEGKRLFNNQFVSIFSLMRDGRDLSAKLSHAAKHLNNGNGNSLFEIIKPYIQFVDGKKRCDHTGIRLMDIWRYFRHTWTNQYTSVPGRSMMILIRDAAAPYHPVIGIAALSSPIIQMSGRDHWIGWQPETFINEIIKQPTKKTAQWMLDILSQAISELYIKDFVREGLFARRDLTKPSEKIIKKLIKEGKIQRNLHHRFTDKTQFESLKKYNARSKRIWEIKAETNLFRSKRAYALADYLRARMVLNDFFKKGPDRTQLLVLAKSSIGRKAICTILRKAKADRVGIAMADISVCGAISPYNSILGGKLVSMLMASPEIIRKYRARYKTAMSEIASSMAGRPITRPPNLVYLGTTSLYGGHSSQYNRIKIPAEVADGRDGMSIKYIKIGMSESFGTSHYSNDTVNALVSLVNHHKGGQRVNSIFGEGASPKLRKVREGLETLGATSFEFLQHGRKRIIYGIPLVTNLKEYLLGIDKRPKYIVPINSQDATNNICEWWMLRWLKMRIQQPKILEDISKQTLIAPTNHDARVKTVVDSFVENPENVGQLEDYI